MRNYPCFQLHLGKEKEKFSYYFVAFMDGAYFVLSRSFSFVAKGVFLARSCDWNSVPDNDFTLVGVKIPSK